MTRARLAELTHGADRLVLAVVRVWVLAEIATAAIDWMWR